MVASKWRTPIVKYAHEPPRSDMRMNLILRHVGEAKSRQNRVQAKRNIVEDEPSLDADLHLAPALFEVPDDEAATRRQAN
jgi:hypothetical protein